MSTPVRKPKASNGRLIIKQMVMNNFKSYADEQCVGPFHKSFSAVVGPNGSGKSNVIDAMLFVFGKRAKQGEVEQISLMKPKSQGSHDEGFLEYLEDIIGTNKYLEHINESHKQLESLNEKRTEVLERVKLADKEKDKLENVKNEAEDYMLKKLFLLKCQEKAMKFALEDNDTKKGDFQISVYGLEESLASERRKIDESKKELNELEMSHNMYMKKQAELDSQLKRCKDELKEYEKQDDKHQNGLKRVKQKIKDIEEKIVKDSAEITKVARQSIESANLITKLQEDNMKLQQNYVDEDYILEELKKNSKVETEPLRTEIADGKRIAYGVDTAFRRVVTLDGVLFETSGTMSGGGRNPSRGKMGTSIKSTSVSRESVIEAENELTQIVEKLKHAQNQISELVRHHEELEKATSILKTELSKSQIEIEELNSQHENLAKQLDSLKAEAEPSNDDLRRLEELKNIISEEEKNINKLTQESKQFKEKELELQNRINNAGGERLKSQQAKVKEYMEAKYDVAISTACPGLDNILVETTAVANACVEILRRNNVGRGTFIVLEQQVRHMPRLKEKVITPEGVPRLFDLIKVQDEKLKLAFFQVMGNTVVAKDNDQ
nr:structural maintenance of chromosomes protein 4 [Tanacetum cinerariifolium]